VITCIVLLLIVALVGVMGLTPPNEPMSDIPPSFPHKEEVSRYALVSMCFDSNFVDAALTVGYSHLRTNSIGERLMLVPGSLPLEDRKALSVFWNISIIQLITPPKQAENPRWVDQFSKFLIWNYTQFDRIIYIDLDSIILQNMDELFLLPSDIPLAAVGSFMGGSFNDGFGAGMLVLPPNQTVLIELFSNIARTEEYNYKMMDQGFLNWWFKFEMYRLPPKYFANIAIHEQSKPSWERIDKTGIKAIHYTLHKPHVFTDGDWESYKIIPAYSVWLDIHNEMKQYLKNKSAERESRSLSAKKFQPVVDLINSLELDMQEVVAYLSSNINTPIVGSPN